MANRASDYFDVWLSTQRIRVRTRIVVNRPGYDPVLLAPHVLFQPGGQAGGKDGWLDYQWLTTIVDASDMSGPELLQQLAQPQRHRPKSAFESYYDEFLQNAMRGRRYQITLGSGELATGVPTSGSIANPADPAVAFSFRADSGGVFRIPFAELREAFPIDSLPAIIRTVGPAVVAANDLMIQIPKTTVDGLREAPYAMLTASLTSGRFVPTAPQLYKYLTVQGSDFAVASIEPRDTQILQLAVGPLNEAVP